ncbi:MAG TPA: M48 family metallopeptidase [Bacillales bacterium]|nr:M48 family metallopeptidase [Bacillales bacterium]
MKKLAYGFVVFYVLYGLIMGWYLFEAAHMGVPPQFRGTPADPNMFMTAHRLDLVHEYSRIQDWLYFLSVPVQWGIYLFILIFGASVWMRNRSHEVTRFRLVHTIIYVLLLSVISFIVSFPISWISHRVSVAYGVSVQPFSDWMHDNFISFWINWIISLATVWVIYALLRRTKRWWFYTWLISIPFVLFLSYIQPVVIDPLYNDFHRLQDNELKNKILNLAHRADIPAHDVYVVNKSEETNALNAYVNGIGSNLRIVLWDTTLKKLNDKEILFVMAHEMGHYVKHHLIKSVLGEIIGLFFGLYIASRLFRWAHRRWGPHCGIPALSDISSLPLLLLIFSVLSFAAAPLENAVSRHAEHEADAYGLKMTHDPKAAIGFFHKAAPISLSEMNPPALVKFFEYGHPTDMERIAYFMHYEKTHSDHNGKKE